MKNLPALKGVHCPACGLRCVLRHHADSAECPEHGLIWGMLLMEIRGMEPWEAQLEIGFSHLRDDLRNAFHALESWIINDSHLKIRLPYIV